MKYFYFSLALAACSPSQGCTHWEEGSTAYVWIDDPNHQFSQEQIDLIHSSTQEWENATGGHITFEFVDGKGQKSLIPIRPVLYAVIEEETGHSAETHIVPWERGGGIDMPYDIDPINFRILMLHEFGHALGLDHDVPGTVMVYGVDKSADYITCRDVMQFCDVNDCDPDLMPACQYEKPTCNC